MAHHMVLDGAIPATSTASAIETPKSLLRRWYNRYVEAFVASQHARTDSEIGRYIAARGGVLTDDIEREISRKFGSGVIGG